MTRTMVNFWLDFALLINFVLLIWSSTIVRFVFPPPSAAEGWSLWNWTLDQWVGFQFAVLCVLTMLIVLHIMLHWTWVCGIIAARMLRREGGKKRTVDDGTRTLWGVGLLIILLNVMGIGIAAAVVLIQGPF